jgi:acetylornithine deacetylase
MNPIEFAHEILPEYRDEVVRVAQELIRIPSRNMPPSGEEKGVQEYIAGYLRQAGLPAEMYEPDTVPGLVEHAAYYPGRSYKDRPNVTSLLPGCGSGRSLLMTGHLDTVPVGDNVWQHPPYDAVIEDGRLYGLGAIDMKGPMAALLVLYKALAEKQVPLRGDLRFECVVDEEEGGVNGTIAGRLRDGSPDGAILVEGTDLKIYPAARGCLISDFIFASTKGTWLDVGKSTETTADAVKQIGTFLTHIDELSEVRCDQPAHPLYESYPNPVPVQVTKVYAGGWGNMVPIAVPPEGRVEVILQTMPGETREKLVGQVDEWLDSLVERYPDVFLSRPEQVYRLRWMVPTAMDPKHPLVETLAEVATEVLGQRPDVLGAPYACDLFALQHVFDIPSLVFGPVGGQAHANDEYIDLESLFKFWETMCALVLCWCG